MAFATATVLKLLVPSTTRDDFLVRYDLRYLSSTMVIKLKGDYLKRQKLEMVDFIVDNMSESSRVRKFALDEDPKTVCTIISYSGQLGGEGVYLTCELSCEVPVYAGGQMVSTVTKKCGTVDVHQNGRAKWRNGPTYVDANGEELKDLLLEAESKARLATKGTASRHNKET